MQIPYCARDKRHALVSQYLFRDTDSGDDLKQRLLHTICRNCVQLHCTLHSRYRVA